jgi:hypothetical protein
VGGGSGRTRPKKQNLRGNQQAGSCPFQDMFMERTNALYNSEMNPAHGFWENIYYLKKCQWNPNWLYITLDTCFIC